MMDCPGFREFERLVSKVKTVFLIFVPLVVRDRNLIGIVSVLYPFILRESVKGYFKIVLISCWE
jgi:hypothetical protein